MNAPMSGLEWANRWWVNGLGSWHSGEIQKRVTVVGCWEQRLTQELPVQKFGKGRSHYLLRLTALS